MYVKSSLSAPFLICRSKALLYALPLAHVVETMRPLPLETLPNMTPPLLGIAMIRASVVPVIDLAVLSGNPISTAPGRYVTLNLPEGRLAALAVDEVLGVWKIETAVLNGVPPLLGEIAKDWVSSMSLLDAELLLVLETAHLIPESLWMDIGVMSSPA